MPHSPVKVIFLQRRRHSPCERRFRTRGNLKAGLVNNPPDNDEGRLYREIGRSKILPQGVCVVNSAGKVLDWVFMFDDDKSVLDFPCQSC